MLQATPSRVLPRSQISVGLDPSLRGHLAGLASGRVLVVDYFASRRCSVVIGDLTCELRAGPPAGDFAELAAIEGVRLFVEQRLLAMMADAGPSLRVVGPPFMRHLAVELEEPERWIDFLEGPAVLVGKGRFHLRAGSKGPDAGSA